MTIEEFRKLEERKNRGKAAVSEHALQTQCVNWWRYTHPEQAKMLLAIPNAGRRTRYERGQVLEEGLVAGTPDLFLALPRGSYHGLWIEMKNGKAGRLSDKQKEMITRLRNEDYAVEVAHTFDEFEKTVEEYLG